MYSAILRQCRLITAYVDNKKKKVGKSFSFAYVITLICSAIKRLIPFLSRTKKILSHASCTVANNSLFFPERVYYKRIMHS